MAPSRTEADAKGGIKDVQKFPEKVMVWLEVCPKRASTLVIFAEGAVDHERSKEKRRYSGTPTYLLYSRTVSKVCLQTF